MLRPTVDIHMLDRNSSNEVDLIVQQVRDLCSVAVEGIRDPGLLYYRPRRRRSP